jgi:hypothetical protein
MGILKKALCVEFQKVKLGMLSRLSRDSSTDAT